MSRVERDLEFTRGDDVSETFHWQDGAGTTINITGRTYAAQIRKDPDATAYWSFTPTVSGAAGNLTLTMLTAVTTTIPPGRWYWDLQETISGLKNTVMAGRVTVWADTTR